MLLVRVHSTRAELEIKAYGVCLVLKKCKVGRARQSQESHAACLNELSQLVLTLPQDAAAPNRPLNQAGRVQAGPENICWCQWQACLG